MTWDFVHDHRGRRLRAYPVQPLLNDPANDSVNDEPYESASQVDFNVERPAQRWEAINVTGARREPEHQPRRFIDGCHRGETVAWLQDAEGHPVPIMLAEIGGVCFESEGRRLVRRFAHVERIVTFVVDPFPWHEVEAFAAELATAGLRLVPASPPRVAGESGQPAVADDGDDPAGDRREPSFDFERMRKHTQNVSNYQMGVLEELAYVQDPSTPTVLDGRLGPRLRSTDLHKQPAIGVIKTQRADHLHPDGWRVLLGLEPGQRTPAFRLGSDRTLTTVTWYLKLDGGRGAMPNYGLVRVELPADRFELIGRDFDYVDQLSMHLLEMRCRRADYGRAPISLEPIVRAEEGLKALFAPPGSLTQMFYRLSGL